ncbi:MAG: nuclear transport factor 2 family protein [Marinifilaceae bacterium]|jgi:ketosteroid isomerase-like protein|nr:nuclear transport factor 2 family protein [Marinifilaceae bacterium]
MERKFKAIDSLSTDLDNKNMDAVLSYLTEDCKFTAGNSDQITGKNSIQEVFQVFFSSVKSTKHDVQDIFESGDSLVHRGFVTYTRLDETQLCVPFCDVFKMRDGKICEYIIYIDWSELF